MPELPEVEHMTRALDGWTAGEQLVALEVLDPTVLGPHADRAASLAGHRVLRCWRRAKWAVLESEGGWSLALHFRMTGKVVRADLAGSAPRRTRLRLQLADAPSVLFDDTRRLGQCRILRTDALPPFWRDHGLGPDVWPGPRDGAFYRDHLSGSRRAIKPLLLDQGRVAGVGNIGASEALWRARIDPRARPADLDEAAWERLADGVRGWIEDTLSAEDQPEIHWVTQGGPNPFAVYGRADGPCPRCGALLEAFSQSGRSTTWCPTCQSAT